MTSTVSADGDLAKIIIQLEEIVKHRKELENEESKLWSLLNKEMDSRFGVPSIDADENKYGAGRIRSGNTVIGRSIANYGSKIIPEELEKNLNILVREGVLNEEGLDRILNKREVVKVEYSINEVELSALATVDEDILRAVKKSLTAPEVRVSKISPKKAQPDDF